MTTTWIPNSCDCKINMDTMTFIKEPLDGKTVEEVLQENQDINQTVTEDQIDDVFKESRSNSKGKIKKKFNKETKNFDDI